MLRKFTPILYGHNLSGKNWFVSFPAELRPWHVVFYTPKFYFGWNIHPNRLRQIVSGPRL